MTIQETLEKAKQGGYEPLQGNHILTLEYAYLLDFAFWQVLGKSLGWKCEHCNGSGKALNHDKCFNCYGAGWADDWLIQWHRLLDFLAEGKSIEEYFETL